MKLEIHFYDHSGETETTRLLRALVKQGEEIMATQAEVAAQINAVSDQLTKATAEIELAIANSGNSSPDTDAALLKLKGLSQALDDINPDATT